jgi:hypothetical protein
LIIDTVQTVVLTLSALTGNGITVTAASPIFETDDVGKSIFIKFLTGDETGIAEIVAFGSSTSVTVNILQDFLALTLPTLGWYLAGTNISGLGHLEGETVGVLTDGGVHADCEVTAGRITLEYPSRYTIIGKKYLGIARTLDMDTPVADGVSQSRLKNVESLFIHFRNTGAGKFGVSKRGLYGLTELMFRREGASQYDYPVPLFSGLKQIPLRDTWANEKKLWIVQDLPLPMTVLAILPSTDIGEAE